MIAVLVRILLFVLLFADAATAKQNYRFPATGQETAVLTIHAVADISAIEPMIRDFQQTAPGIAVDFTDYLTNELYDLLAAQCAKGKTMAEIADALRVSYKTVANNCTQLRQKLGARSAMDLMRIAIDAKLG